MEQLQVLQEILAEMKGLRAQVTALQRRLMDDAPNYQRPLAAFGAFDWSSIGAAVTETDGSGPSRLEYGGHIFTRRNGRGKFGEAIWFSRPQGKNEDGSTAYARLITFKNYSDAEPVPADLQKSPALPPAQIDGARASRKSPPPPPIADAGLFGYTYGDGTTAEKAAEQTAFNAYRRAHGEKSPPNVTALRQWYSQQPRT